MKFFLFLFFIFPCASFAQIELGGSKDGSPAPKLWIETNIYNFGRIPFSVPVTTFFEIKNTGNAPLKLLKAEPTCNCTLVDFTTEEIKPGEKGFVKVTYDAMISGKFDKRIFLYTNAFEGEMDLMLKGEVFFIANGN